ncbi:MAG: PIN domain-containing protein [Thermoprotei archaeon]|nr:PIN domain-containing protein [Thermoprotei archaeon]
MRMFIDSSVFLRLFLGEPGADKAQEILELVERSRVLGYITPLVLEEISFKMI